MTWGYDKLCGDDGRFPENVAREAELLYLREKVFELQATVNQYERCMVQAAIEIEKLRGRICD